MIPDAPARAAAADPTRSFVVQAPAGSGKTALLIQRYLALLATVDSPEEILALTFTRKAAEEMRARVLTALEGAAGAPPACGEYEQERAHLARAAAARAQGRDWLLADCPGRLRIQTFDAFCAQVVNQWPAAAGVGVAPAIATDAGALYAEAALATFERLGHDDAVGQGLAELLPALGNDVDRFVGLVSDLLARREQWLPIVLEVGQAPTGHARERLERVFADLAYAALARVRALFPPSALPAACEYLAEQTGDDSWDPRVLTATGPGALARWQELARHFLTSGGTLRKQLPGWPKRLGPTRAFVAGLGDSEALGAALADLAAWGAGVYADDQWRRLLALIRILPAASAELQLVFARRNQWDFTEVALRALQALGAGGEPTAGAVRLDRRLRHILVDEFQDTSVLQYRLLERLVDEWVPGEDRSVFVVGDPMQSIYAFRKAEVGLFFRLAQEGLGHWALAPLTLTANFRSEAGLVAWVNDSFARLLPHAFVADQGAVPHVAAVAMKDGPGEVGLHALGDVDLKTEARYVARLVADIRAARPEEVVAILVRSRTHGHAIAEALVAAGLRFSGDGLYSLGARPVVRDLLALTETLLFPAARLAAVSVLRAPWCGLDLDDLACLCEGDDRPVLVLLNDEARLAALSDAGRVRARHVYRALAAAEAARGQCGLTQLVEDTWLALNGPAALESSAGLRECEIFFTTLADLEAAGEVDIWQLRDRLGGLYAPADSAAEAARLHVLTIHAAKGLEFDTVICPALGRRTRTDDRPLLLALETTTSQGPDLLLAPLKAHDADHDPLYEAVWGFAARRRDHEVRRLLYVAFTRARGGLHLVGHVVPKDDGTLRSPGGLLAVLWPVIGDAFVASLPAACETRAQPSPPAAGPYRLPLAALSSPVLPEMTAGRDEDGWPDGSVVFDWAGTCIRIVGTVVHALLADLSDHKFPGDGVVPASVLRRARALLQGHGLSGPDLDAACATIAEALTRAVTCEHGRFILAPHADARNEYAVSAFAQGRLVVARVDRTFIDPDGTRWIVDYKTSRHQGSDREGFLDSEQARYRDQLEGYGRLFWAWEGRPVVLALYFPLLAAWRTWRYAPS